MYRCIIVDDEELARELIEVHLSKLDNFDLVASCESAIEAHKVLQENQIDLIFLDIKMPQMKGTDFVKSLVYKPKIILTTAYREYALEGYELNVVDYLLKPISFTRFFKAIEKFLALLNNSSNIANQKEHLFVRHNKKNIKVCLSDILYIESLKDYIKIKLDNKKTILVKEGITKFYEKLDARFLRVHRSYVVNTKKITAFTKKDVEIDKIEIPIGESYKMQIIKQLSD